MLPPAVLPMRIWPQEFECSFLSLIGQATPGTVGGVASLRELPEGLSAEPVDQDVFDGPATLLDLSEVSSAEPVRLDDFEFTSRTPSMLGKHKRGHRQGSKLVRSPEDFSTRRMTRSCAKKSGFKPTSAIPNKPSSLRRPRAKKPRYGSVSQEENSSAAGEHSTAVPPPTPISLMQRIGESLGISPEKLTEDKLMASPEKKDQHNDRDDK